MATINCLNIFKVFIFIIVHLINKYINYIHILSNFFNDNVKTNYSITFWIYKTVKKKTFSALNSGVGIFNKKKCVCMFALSFEKRTIIEFYFKTQISKYFLLKQFWTQLYWFDGQINHQSMHYAYVMFTTGTYIYTLANDMKNIYLCDHPN